MDFKVSSKPSNIIGVIPARYDSNRLPGKPLADICGRPMIQWVYENSMKCNNIDYLVVATDDKRIYDAVIGFGGNCIITSKSHISGTSRVCEVADIMPNFDYFINIQGDQPFIKESTLDDICLAMLNVGNELAVVTLIANIKEEDEDDISIPKVVIDKNNKAIYFSRFPIPFVSNIHNNDISIYYKHLGVYGFTKSSIKVIKNLTPSYLEKAEGLEQLTWIYEGIPIYAKHSEDIDKISVDTKYDLEIAIEIAISKIAEENSDK
jgi:3-deoxy-manno-octulosonate cytidylyltransferase (CMP-KDO synthetase)